MGSHQEPAGSQSEPAAGALAVETALRAHSHRLRKYITKNLPADVREQHDPQDVLQDVFFEAFRRAGSFPANDSTAGLYWLITVARNRLRHLIRLRRTAKRGGGWTNFGDPAAANDSLVALLEELAVYRRTPSKSAAAREFMVAMENALDRLPQDYALVIRLRHLEGESLKTIAARMQRSEGAVEMLCNRGLAALRAELRSISMYS